MYHLPFRRALSSKVVHRLLTKRIVTLNRFTVAPVCQRNFSFTPRRHLPPHQLVTLPALSPTMEFGTIKSWEVKVGDEVEEGDILCEVETDKAVVAFEAIGIEGYVAAIVHPEGSKDIKLGELVCVIVENKTDVAAFKNYKTGDSNGAEPSKVSAEPETTKPAKAGQSYGSHEIINLPALSPTMETGNLISWNVVVGEEIVDGESVIAEIETDKAIITFEAAGIEGYVAALLHPEGTKDIKLGEPLLVIVENKSDVGNFKDFTLSSVAPPTVSPPVPPTVTAPDIDVIGDAPEIVVKEHHSASSGQRLKVSPYAATLAAEKNIPLTQVKGTGPGGRIRADDVINYVPTKSVETPKPVAAVKPTTAPKPVLSLAEDFSAADYTEIDVTNMRRTIAARLSESKNTIPHYYLTRSIRTDNINELRNQLNQISEVRISLNDFIIKAASLACLNVPEANSAWMGDTIRQYNVVDMSVAVATPNGLITPIVFDSHIKGLLQISKDLKELAGKAREGKLQPAEFVGGTFTISNLGNMGISHFTAVINPPQSCILAIGSTTEKLIPCDSEKGFKVVNEMKVTLSCDHRTVDGAVGAKWLKHFAEYIENPVTMHLYP